MKQKVADHEAKNGIPEEFECFVIQNVAPARFVRERFMSKRALKNLGLAKSVANASFE